MDEQSLQEIRTFFEELPHQATHFAIRLCVALIVIFLALRVIRVLVNIIRKSMTRANADEGVKKALDAARITIPFPQREVWVKTQS